LADHDLCFPLVSELKKQYLHPHKAEIDKKWSVLFFTWAHWVPYSSEQIQKLKEEIKKAERIILLYDASFGSSVKRLLQQMRDLREHKQIFKRVNEVCYMTDFPKIDLFSTFKKRFAFQTSAAVNITYSSQLSRDLFSNYNPKIKRPYWTMVSGNLGTAYRQEVLKTIEIFIENSSSCIKIEGDQEIIKDQKLFFWSVGKSMLSLDRYFDLLRNSNFTLCLPGTYWTPRPFESIACGSIPILEDDYMHSYDIPFKDGENCISLGKISHGDIWSKVLNRILQFSEERILEIRNNIYKLRNTHLLPEVHFERQIKRYLGD